MESKLSSALLEILFVLLNTGSIQITGWFENRDKASLNLLFNIKDTELFNAISSGLSDLDFILELLVIGFNLFTK